MSKLSSNRRRATCSLQLNGRKISSGRAVENFPIGAATAAKRWVLAPVRIVLYSVCLSKHAHVFIYTARRMAGARAHTAAAAQRDIQVNANSPTAHLFANGSLCTSPGMEILVANSVMSPLDTDYFLYIENQGAPI
jgi:hypothetical protein